MRLTKAAIAQLTLPEGKTEQIIFDEGLPGFGIRLRAGGKKTWIVQYRVGTKQRRITLGTIETVDPDEARKRAKTALSKIHLGGDPQAEKAGNKTQASLSLGKVAEDYLARRAKLRLKPRSLLEVQRHLRQHWAPLSGQPIQRLRRQDIAQRLGEISNENGPFAANRARAALSALFSWAMGEGLVDSSPVVGTNKATPETSRDRVLTDAELKTIWENAGEGEYGRIVRLLILTGQRREEVGGMRWDELRLEDGVWSIGPERTKNRLPHDVPLSRAALGILASVEKRDERAFVFGSGAGPYQGWSNAKAALDKRIKIQPWRLHDIRRTVATRMADLGVLPHVIEAVLNHISGHKAGVAGIYNRSVYAAEKREALDMWASHICGSPYDIR